MHDVSRDYVDGIPQRRLPAAMRDDLIKSRIHGATPAFAQEVKQQGLGSLDIDELVKMRIHGVTPEFIKAMSDLGYKDLPIDKLVRAADPRRRRRTSSRAWRRSGSRTRALDDLVKFRIHGVRPEFIKTFADLGYKNLDAEDLVKMRIHGVTTQIGARSWRTSATRTCRSTIS